ncbi:MAG: hypothetical protein H6868_09225 [Rhodospirillales bacterium]|nr:hypothetical protein [Rhodospirillales bacterium]
MPINAVRNVDIFHRNSDGTGELSAKFRATVLDIVSKKKGNSFVSFALLRRHDDSHVVAVGLSKKHREKMRVGGHVEAYTHTTNCTQFVKFSGKQYRVSRQMDFCERKLPVFIPRV